MLDWLDANRDLLGWLVGASILTFVGSLIVLPLLVARIRSDYFMHPEPPPESWRARHNAAHLALRLLRNGLGVTLVLAGIVLSVPLVPGQGVLTILVGLSLLSFPGKRALELRLVRQRPVLAAINWMRARANRPPLKLPPRTDRNGRSAG